MSLNRTQREVEPYQYRVTQANIDGAYQQVNALQGWNSVTLVRGLGMGFGPRCAIRPVPHGSAVSADTRDGGITVQAAPVCATRGRQV